ncbi:MAG: dockerin type I domain-containing protein [Myxococcota bacterium]
MSQEDRSAAASSFSHRAPERTGHLRRALSRFAFLAGAALFIFFLLPTEDAFAQTCGGNNQRYCCVWEGSACDAGHGGILATGPGTGQSCSNSGFPFYLNGSSAGTCYKTRVHPPFCGRVNQAPCALTVQARLGIRSCQTNLIELVGPSGVRCRAIDSDGFPSHCGGLQEAPCIVTEHIPSCKSNYFEHAGTCNAQDSAGYPLFCGDEFESACNITLQAQLGITSCKGELVENAGQCRNGDDLFPIQCGDLDERACTIIEHIPSCKSGLTELIGSEGATCRQVGTDGFPNHCGAFGQPACGLLENIPSCKPNAYEVASQALPYPDNGWCVDKETFPAYRAQPASVEEPAPGPKTVFLIHGLESGKQAFDAFELQAGFAELDLLKVYLVDYNSDGDSVETGLKIFDQASGDEVCTINSRLDGYTFSLPMVSRLLSEAIRNQSNCRVAGSGTGYENVALVAHSMGGIVARDLVYRHFDSLLQEGIRITDVVTLGSPHRGGGGAIPEVADGADLSCLVASLQPKFHQVCLMEAWQSALQEAREAADANGAPFIDNLDFPEIRWTTIAAADSKATTDQELLTFTDPITRHDALVAHVSSFSIASDLCFPNVDRATQPPEIANRSALNISESAAWFDHDWPGAVADFANLQSGYGYNPWNGFNLGPLNRVRILPTDAENDSLTARCHSPGTSKAYPFLSYLTPTSEPDKVPNWAANNTRYVGFPAGSDFDAPHGDLIGAEDTSEDSEPTAAPHVSIRSYVWTVLSDGLRTNDVNRDGWVNQTDIDLVEAAIDNANRPSGYFENYEIQYDLNGDGFTTQFDLDIVVPEPSFGVGIATGMLVLLGARRRKE